MAKRRLAIFTIVQNEDFHLPIWFKYYSGLVPPTDIYVLNHSTTTPNGVEFLKELASKGVHVVDIFNEKSYDHDWLARTGSNFQNGLLAGYEITICVDADEYLILESGSDSKVGFVEHIESKIKDDKLIIMRAKGFSVEQQTRPFDLSPGAIDSSANILGQRGFYRRSPTYDKPAISSVPCDWTRGFHHVAIPRRLDPIHIHSVMEHSLNLTSGVVLLHTHKIDRVMCHNKHKEQAQRPWLSLETGGLHNRIHGVGFDRWFDGRMCPADGPISLIPKVYRTLF